MDNFDNKQSRETLDLPLTCYTSPTLITCAFRLSEVGRLLLDLDPYSGTDQLGMFPFFSYENRCYGETRRLSVVFRRLVRMGSVPACWRQANVIEIP